MCCRCVNWCGLAVNYGDIITIEPGKMGGKPCIRGLRITVYDVLDYLASGMTEAEILADFPDLQADDLRAALAFAAANGVSFPLPLETPTPRPRFLLR